ncbi:MAG: ABC transporter permease [Clostridia bacterium]|nr:ABC transporter permease [Clostridia bacterium]
MTNTHHEPLMRIVKRSESTFKHKVIIRLIAVLLALVIDAMFIFFVTGLNPFAVYTTMFQGTFSNPMRFSWAMRDLASLLLVGIALAPAFKMRFWNIGAEGQVLVGALATAAVMVYYGGKLPNALLYPTMLIAALAAGALWGFVPGVFKAKFGTNETLFTLMMNYVAIQLVACCVNIWRGQASGLGKLNMKSKAGWFPQVFGQRYNINLIVVVLLVVLMYCYLRYTKQGYEISVVGESENTARYAGINVGKVIIRTMILSGALCGLTGFLIVGGRDQTISTGTAGGNGFTAIIVAWLAKFNTFYMALISFLLIFLEKGAGEIASAYNLNDFASDIIAGIILFCILGSEFFINYKPIFRSSKQTSIGKEVA